MKKVNDDNAILVQNRGAVQLCFGLRQGKLKGLTTKIKRTEEKLNLFIKKVFQPKK